MADAVERHLTLLQVAVEAHNGVLFKVVGDAVQAAFLSVPETVSAVRAAAVPDRPACCLAGTPPSREDAQVAERAQKVSSE
jgi:class 3 adenylate cyclase